MSHLESSLEVGSHIISGKQIFFSHYSDLIFQCSKKYKKTRVRKISEALVVMSAPLPTSRSV